MVAYFIQHAVQSHVIYFDAQIVYVFPLELLAILYHSLIIFLLSVTKKDVPDSPSSVPGPALGNQ